MAKTTKKTTTQRPKRTPAQRQARRQRLLRRALLVLLALGLGAAWAWQRTLPLERIAVVGAVHAPADEVAALTQAQPDSVALFSLGVALMADRAQRHPWVRTASVRRMPTGTLRIAVTERQPVVLVLDGAGRPSHFLDAEGFAMPATGAAPALYDVPVMHDAPAYHPMQPVESAGLRSLLAALATAEPHPGAGLRDRVGATRSPSGPRPPAATAASKSAWATPIRTASSARCGPSGSRSCPARRRSNWSTSASMARW